MAREMYAHSINSTFMLCPRPSVNQGGRIHIVMKSLWKYRVKTQQNKITERKPRIVTDGSRVADLPENEFAGTPTPNAVNSAYAIAAFFGVKVNAGDVPAAYVQVDMPENDTIYYVTQVQGFIDFEHPDWVLRLNKCLYRVSCSSHHWNATFVKFLTEELGMMRMNSDLSVC
jgi:hypothetical protein